MFYKSQNHNPNYLASICRIDNIRKHNNADRLQVTTIYFCNVITGTSAKVGDLVVYFPVESKISKEFLSYTNSLDDPLENRDKTIKGYFSSRKCRVRPVSLRGEKSEGYIIPVSQLENFCKDVLGEKILITENHIGTDFDEIFSHKICEKYEVPVKAVNLQNFKKSKGKIKRYQSKLVENQFRFHPDTIQLKREIYKIHPDDHISISMKLHGCNFVVSHVLTKRQLNFKDKIAKFFGVNVNETEYGLIYSSRAVIKNGNMLDEGEKHNHWYDSDIWKIVADKIFPFLKKGISVTGEIVGYTPIGKAIQPLYDYGCNPNELDFYIFNVTYTSPCGDVYTFNPLQIKSFCEKLGFKTPQLFYYGKAKDLFPELNVTDHWHENFLQRMVDSYLEKKCKICKNDVWEEGVILNNWRNQDWQAYKLKSWNFLGYEREQLDNDNVSIDSSSR